MLLLPAMASVHALVSPAQKQSSDSGYGEFEPSVFDKPAVRRAGSAVGCEKDYGRCGECLAVGERRCRDCMVLLCAQHCQLHGSSKATAGHIVESGEDRSQSSSQCSTHDGETCSGFCETCHRPVCNSCDCSSASSVHHVVSLSTAARETRSSLECLVTSTRTLALEELVSSLRGVSDAKTQVLSDSAKLQEKIKTFYSQQMDLLRQEQAMLLDQVSAATNENLKELGRHRDGLQSVLTSTASSVEFTCRALSLSSNMEVLAMHRHLSSRLYSICNASTGANHLHQSAGKHPLPEFKVNQEAVERLQEILEDTGLSTLEEPEQEWPPEEVDGAIVSTRPIDVLGPLQAGERSASFPSATRAKHANNDDTMEISFLKTTSQVTQPTSSDFNEHLHGLAD